ncbi:MAG: lysylphosphatidylglycerol synthase domain-containing protein, partial [Acidobacteriota bacterium]
MSDSINSLQPTAAGLQKPASTGLKLFFKIAVGLGILALVIWKLDASRMFATLSSFSPATIFPVMMLHMVMFLSAAIAVTLLGRSINKELAWGVGMRGFLATISFSMFMPGRIGDFGLPFYWKQYLSYGEAIGVVLVDKILTLTWIGLLGLGAIHLLFDRFITASALALCLIPLLTNLSL